jgi:hypothetical protein
MPAYLGFILALASVVLFLACLFLPSISRSLFLTYSCSSLMDYSILTNVLSCSYFDLAFRFISGFSNLFTAVGFFKLLLFISFFCYQVLLFFCFFFFLFGST